jgi:hypothetical protein
MTLSKTSRFYKKLEKRINRFGVCMRKKNSLQVLIRGKKEKSVLLHEHVTNWNELIDFSFCFGLKLVTSRSPSYELQMKWFFFPKIFKIMIYQVMVLDSIISSCNKTRAIQIFKSKFDLVKTQSNETRNELGWKSFITCRD